LKSEAYEEGNMEDGDSGADKHPHRNRNYDGCDELYGVKKEVELPQIGGSTS